MTPEQEAIRDRIADAIGPPRDAERGYNALGWRTTTLLFADRLIAAGIRPVGADEVVVPRSSIREGWARVDRGGVAYFLVADGHTDTNQERVGVISPWPPEAA